MIIAIIDSEIDNDLLNEINVIKRFEIARFDNKIYAIEGQAEDKIGHGTAVTSIISKLVPAAEFIIIKISNLEDIEYDCLLYALTYIEENINCDVINISAGVEIINDFQELEGICTRLRKRGIYILSALSNEGAVSYPAAIESVIGVDSFGGLLKKRGEYAYVDGTVINLIFGDVFYRTQWLGKVNTLVKGTSFATAYATGIVAKYFMQSDKEYGIESINDYLKRQAKYIISNSEEAIARPKFKIKKAIVFPYNKEVHALLRYRSQLKFEIVGLYDEALKGVVGSEQYGEIVKSYKNIDWKEEFDTLILGCTEELSNLTGINYKKEIIDKCKLYGKNIYSFEEATVEDDTIFWPTIRANNVPQNRLGRLRRSNVPIIGVVGTSSQQGKFSLQMELKRMLEAMEYNVGHICTEPSGYLFGADMVFPIGYNSTIDEKISLIDYIPILNEELWNIEIKGKEVILVGGQSGSINYTTTHLSQYNLYQHSFLLGTMPDVYVLCINPHDPIEYIKRTINYLNNIGNGMTIALVIYPIKTKIMQNGMSFKKEKLTKEQIEQLKENLQEAFELPVFVMGVEDEIRNLSEKIIDYF